MGKTTKNDSAAVALPRSRKKAAEKFSDATVRGKLAPGYHSDGNGLYLVVGVSGARSWIFRFRWDGKLKDMGLGSYPDISLKDARQRAAAARKLREGGVNPIEARRSKSGEEAALPKAEVNGAVTFGQVADQVKRTMMTQFVNRLQRRRPTPFTEADKALEDRKIRKRENPLSLSLDKHCAAIREKAVQDIDTDDVLSILEPIWTKTPESADRTRSRIEAVLDAASARKQRTGDNPARWRGHLEHLLPERPVLVKGHHPAMPYADIPKFMAELRKRTAMSAYALQFDILTVVRTTECLGAKWTEFYDDDTLWIVPGIRMKGDDAPDHRVPLPPQATALLKSLRSISGSGRYVFPTEDADQPLSEAAMMRLLERMGYGHLTVHGFRSSFSDWAGDETEFPDAIIEMCLAHAVGSAVRRAYRRQDALDRRREVMQAWANFVLGEISATGGASENP